MLWDINLALGNGGCGAPFDVCRTRLGLAVGAFRAPFLVLKLLADFVPADPFPIIPNTILHGAILSSEVAASRRAISKKRLKNSILYAVSAAL